MGAVAAVTPPGLSDQRLKISQREKIILIAPLNIKYLMVNIYPVNLFQISPVLSRISAGVPRQCCYTLNCAASPFRIFKTRNELHILSARADIAVRDK